MTGEPTGKSDESLKAEAHRHGAVYAWWERYRTTNVIVLSLLLFGAIIGLGNLVTAVETVTTFVSARVASFSGQKSAAKMQTDSAAENATRQFAPVQVLLADGKTAKVSWNMEYEVMPKDAPMYAVEFDGMADVQQQLEAAFKRNLLRKAAAVDSRHLSSVRIELENGLADELRKEFAPRGVTIESISLGELTTQ